MNGTEDNSSEPSPCLQGILISKRCVCLNLSAHIIMCAKNKLELKGLLLLVSI